MPLFKQSAVGGNVRARFVDYADNAHRHAHLGYPHAVRAHLSADNFAHGVGERAELFAGGSHALYTLVVKAQAVLH